MTDFNVETIKSRIAKLLRLSESPNQAEAEAALGKVQEMLQKYNLEMSDVVKLGTDKKQTSPIEEGSSVNIGDDTWKRSIHASVAHAFQCLSLMYQTRAGGKLTRTGVFIGRSLDVSIAASVTAFLFETAVRSEQESWKHFTGYKGGNTRNVYRRSYLAGFAQGIVNVSTRRRCELDQETVSSTALAVRVADQIREFVSAQHSSVRTVTHRMPQAGHSEGRSEGYTKGSNQNLNGGLKG